MNAEFPNKTAHTNLSHNKWQLLLLITNVIQYDHLSNIRTDTCDKRHFSQLLKILFYIDSCTKQSKDSWTDIYLNAMLKNRNCCNWQVLLAQSKYLTLMEFIAVCEVFSSKAHGKLNFFKYKNSAKFYRGSEFWYYFSLEIETRYFR